MNARMVISFSDRMQAELTRTYLDSYGIPVLIRLETDIGYAGAIFSANGFRLYVPDDSYEEAMKLLADIPIEDKKP